ncbi:MAG: hypothetical protein JOY99_00185 [Sphingomonadaceae bacterium]|nr:hypothetical protein [Sphingomonadaceae bacterium]
MAASLEDIVSGIVKERFTDAKIDSISIEPDSDSDGDPILRITVVFDSDVSGLESSKLAGLVRHVRPKLRERGDTGFPIFRFLSKRDNDRLRHAAA